jgi:hypothetical protein
MNERIKQLAEQAGLKVNPDGEIGPAFFGSVDAGYRKFAELIVRECVEVCEALKEDDGFDANFARTTCANEIKQHFGVEE